MSHEMKELLVNFWRRSFFIEPMLILFFVFSFIVGLFYYNKNKERLLFVAYFFSGVILFVPSPIMSICKILTGRQLMIYEEVANTFFELMEFLAFYFFFKK